MKMILVSLIGLVSTIASAQNICGDTTKYQRRVDLGNGMSAFYEPGVWSQQSQTHFISPYHTDGDALCRYVGMSKHVVNSIRMRSLAGASLISIAADDKWTIYPSDMRAVEVVDVVHCQ